MSADRKQILWVEDRPDTIAGDMEFADEQDWLEIVQVSGSTGLMNELERLVGSGRSHGLAGIVMDIQLYGVNDLGPFEDVHDRRFESNEAGWNLVERVLRGDNSRYKNIPLLIYSVQPLDEEGRNRLRVLEKRTAASVVYVEKTLDADRPSPGFKEWLLGVRG